MTVACHVCNAPTSLNLCSTCTDRLRQRLLGLPTLIGYLDDAAVGAIRLGEPGERVSTGAHVLSGLHYNSKAADLAVDIRWMLDTHANRLAVRRRLIISPPVNWHRDPSQYVYTATDYAMFLAANVRALAGADDVGTLVKRCERSIKQGMAIINRAVPPQFCGPCPSIIIEHDRCTDCARRAHDCGTRLMAKRGAREVSCPTCRSTHNVEELVEHLLARADHHRCTIPELHRVLRMLKEPVPLSTLYRWAEPKTARRGSGQLRPAGYLGVDKKTISESRKDPRDQAIYPVSMARRRRRDNQSAKTTRKQKGSG